MKLKKIKIYIVRETTFEQNLKQNFFTFLKNLYFMSISVKCIFWQIFKKIVENKDFYRKKDDFWGKFYSYFFIYFFQKILYFVSISVKCISCRKKRFSKKSDYNYKLTDSLLQTDLQTNWFIEELRS